MPTTTVDLGEHCQGAISLCCPQCRGDRLHYGRVTVFHRIEDDEMITQTVVTGPTATVEAVPNLRTTNSSSRRDGIELSFSVSCATGRKIQTLQINECSCGLRSIRGRLCLNGVLKVERLYSYWAEILT
jgi:hypothetical protein